MRLVSYDHPFPFPFPSHSFARSFSPPSSLGPLVKKIKDSQIEVIINALCSNMFSDSEKLRDISSVGGCFM